MFTTEFSNYLTLFEYSTAFIVYAISLQFIIRILVSLFKRSKKIVLQEKNGLSNLLIANLILWAILMGSALPHIIVMVTHWSPDDRFMNPDLIFWSTIITECMMAMIPYSIIFLTLDRIFCIEFLTGYVEHHKLNLLALCVLTLLGILAINMYAFCHIFPLPALTNCNVFACLMTNGNTTFIFCKLFGGFLIILTGALFLVKLRKRQTTIITGLISHPQYVPANKIDPDSLVKLMMCTELLLNFLPQLIIFIIQTIIGHQIASSIGPINHFLNCFDALVSSLTYQHTLRRYIKVNSGTTTAVINLINLAGAGGSGSGSGGGAGGSHDQQQGQPKRSLSHRV